jgi:RND family efflux transporter MFP subunit
VTAEVKEAETSSVASVAAAVQARRRAALSARITASVVELPFREGERVAADSVVVRLDDGALRAAVQAAEAALAAAEAERGRMASLEERGAATPRERQQADAQAAAARAGLAAARDNLSYGALRAPFAGIVTSRPVNLGDVVSPGTPLVEIEGDEGYELRATVGAAQVSALRPGSELEAVIDDVDHTLTARITAVSPSGDPATHRFEVRADLPPARGLRSGLFARLQVPSRASSPQLLVPTTALFERGGLVGVFVVADGVARLRWIAPGAAMGDLTEVRSGLAPGERVAVLPLGLEDGTLVTEAR